MGVRLCHHTWLEHGHRGTAAIPNHFPHLLGGKKLSCPSPAPTILHRGSVFNNLSQAWKICLFLEQGCPAHTWVMAVSSQRWLAFHDTIYFACFMAQSWNFYLMGVILHPQNSPVNFTGLLGLPMKVKFMVSLMFLLYGPEQQADLAGGSVLLGAEQLFSLCFSLRIPASLPAAPEAHEAALMECTKHFQTALVRDRHLSYFTLPKPPAWIYTLGNCWICGGLISLPFGALALCFVQCMRAESYSSVSASQCGVGGQVTNPAPENAQTMLWFIPGSFSPSVSGVKILDLEFVRNFQKVASFPSSRFTSHLHFLVLSVWLCLFNA